MINYRLLLFSFLTGEAYLILLGIFCQISYMIHLKMQVRVKYDTVKVLKISVMNFP